MACEGSLSVRSANGSYWLHRALHDDRHGATPGSQSGVQDVDADAILTSFPPVLEIA